METYEFENIKSNLFKYKFTSLNYTEFDDVKEYIIIANDPELVLIYGCNSEFNEWHWACSDVNKLINAINESNKNGLIKFIPREWVDIFKQNGFSFYAIYNDYFNDDLKYSDDVGSYDFLQLNECKEASEVTLSCKDQSRGFHGETEEWMKAWISDKDENLSNKAVLVHKEDKKIAGILCAATYPASNKNGLIVWVREVAVRTEYQRKGIARKLIKQAINYGIEHGAVKSFLAADENNIHAIKLYKSLGYNGKYNEAEINMIKE